MTTADVIVDDSNLDGQQMDSLVVDTLVVDTLADAPVTDAPPSATGSWVRFSAGTAPMGSPPTEACRQPALTTEDEHLVTLTHDFEIATREVTQGEFEGRMGYQPAIFTSCGTSCPVETVSWDEAAAYCNALSVSVGTAPCYDCLGSGAATVCKVAAGFGGKALYSCPGYRLPTEAEWERAYRAGTNTAYYSGTNDPARCADCAVADVNAETIAWYCYNAGDTPHPVGEKGANTRGLLDMAGNVWEWVHDYYQAILGNQPVTDPVGSSLPPDHTIRGGSFKSAPSHLRASARSAAYSRREDIGFRCARSVP